MAAAATTSGAAAVAGSPGVAPTNNFLSDAGQNIDATKFAALQSIAQSGSQGQAGLALAGQQQVAARQQALKDAMAFSAARGGAFNPAVQQNTQAQVSAPFDSHIAATDMVANNFKQAEGATNNAYGGYFNLAKAGLPVANASLGQTIANDKVTAANNAMKNQLSMIRLQQEIAKANGTATTPSQIIANLGGESNAGPTLINAANNVNTPHSPPGTSGMNDAALRALAGDRQITTPAGEGQQAGLSPALAQSLTAKGVATQQAQQARALATTKALVANQGVQDYGAGLPDAIAHLTGVDDKGQPVSKDDPATVLKNLIAGGMNAQTAAKVVKDATAIANSTAP